MASDCFNVRLVERPQPAKPLPAAAILTALQRDLDHVRQHARNHDWEAMTEALEHLNTVAAAWHGQSVPAAALVAGFVEKELPALSRDLQSVRGDLEKESRQIQESRRQLRAAKGFRAPTLPDRTTRLNVSA